MRFFIRNSALLIVTGMLGGCCMETKPAGHSTAAATTVSSTKPYTIPFGGSNVLRITAPADYKAVAKEGSLKFTDPKTNREFEFWLVPGVTTVDAAIAAVPHTIEGEFKNLKPNQTLDVTVAGSPAKRLMGPGNEADDGDPGAADVTVFKAGDHIFVSCIHGETLAEADRQAMLALLGTAQLP
jgi:hypothetical protein